MKYIFVSVGAVRFACLGYKALFYNDDELFIKTKITFFANVAIGFTFL